MADDGDDWFTSADDEQPTEDVAGETQTAEGGPPTEGEATAEAAEGAAEAPAEPEAAEEEYLDPDKLLLFKHWIRPKFLQYKYLYDYQYNYYDHVLDYIDKRSKGHTVGPLRPQTWAERALRTYSNRDYQHHKFRSSLEDTKLVTKTELSGHFQTYHNRRYLSKRLTSL